MFTDKITICQLQIENDEAETPQKIRWQTVNTGAESRKKVTIVSIRVLRLFPVEHE